jgi:NADPH:quinone reductase-like Zn-dependent oxidoreductase
MASQKALHIPYVLGPFTQFSRPIPSPGEHDVLVKLEAAALNPADWKLRKFPGYIKEYPAMVGTDGAGVVVKVGSQVKGVSVGDRV